MFDDAVIDDLRERVKLAIPNPNRVSHTLAVEKEAVMYANKFGIPADGARVAALLHDITKCCSNQEHLKIIKKYKVPIDGLELASPKLYHAITGAAVAQHEYGVDDEEVLGAIRWHTTARGKMTLLEKIIYMADFTEETRTYEGAKEIRRYTHEDFDSGMLFSLNYSICSVVEKGGLLHPQTVEARNELAFLKLKK